MEYSRNAYILFHRVLEPSRVDHLDLGVLGVHRRGDIGWHEGESQG